MSKKDKIKGIIFDLGGVLVEAFGKEFLEYASEKLKAPKDKLGVMIQKEEPALQRGEITNIEFWQRVCDRLSIECPSKKILLTLWLKPYKQQAKIKKDTLALVKRLQKNRYKTAILSNTQEEHNQINKKRKLFDYFDLVLLSNEVGMRKPERKFFQLASKELGIPFTQLVFVDDEMRWVRAAKRCGLKAILFKSAGQLEKVLNKLGIHVD